MLSRLGLVIHWLGFLAFLPAAIYLLITEPRETYKFIDNPAFYYPTDLETQAINEWLQLVPEDVQDSDEANAALAKLSAPVLQALANKNLANFNTGMTKQVAVKDWAGFTVLLSVLSIPSWLFSWLVNFILTGHKSPLPWVANKEAT